MFVKNGNQVSIGDLNLGLSKYKQGFAFIGFLGQDVAEAVANTEPDLFDRRAKKYLKTNKSFEEVRDLIVMLVEKSFRLKKMNVLLEYLCILNGARVVFEEVA